MLFFSHRGVTDAENQLLGTDRMIKALNKRPDAFPEETLSNVMEGIDAFTAGTEQFDDITMMCLRYNRPAEPSDPE